MAVQVVVQLHLDALLAVAAVEHVTTMHTLATQVRHHFGVVTLVVAAVVDFLVPVLI